MSPLLLVTILIASWLVFIAIIHAVLLPWLSRGPSNDPLTGLIWRGTRLYARLIHRLQTTGTERLPTAEGHGGLIVIANHTGAADPFLIQAPCPFLIRWVMAREFMTESLQWAWDRFGMIPVDRDGQDSGPLREAIRHVRKGGAIGIFPEGRIATTHGEIWPFMNGLDLIAAKTKAPIVLAWIHGTPEVTDTMEALTTRSHSRVEFIQRIEYGDIPEGESVTEFLRQKLAETSGWPLTDEIRPR